MTRFITALLLVLFGFGSPLQAQMGSGNGAAGAHDPELMEAQQRLQELQQQLGRIQQEAFEGSTELQEKQQKLEERATAKMEDLGYDPKSHYARMEEIYQRFEDGEGELSQEEQQELANEFQNEQMQLQQAQQEAMQDEEFRSEMEREMRAFQEDLMAAMEADFPETPELIEEFESLQAELRQSMGSQGAAPGGAQGGAME